MAVNQSVSLRQRYQSMDMAWKLNKRAKRVNNYLHNFEFYYGNLVTTVCSQSLWVLVNLCRHWLKVATLR